MNHLNATLSNSEDEKILQELLINNREFERLEALISEFNLFESIGAVHQELRHSDFLAFLLNPKENHGLGDIFLKRLLQHLLIKSPTKSLSPISLSIWKLDEVSVLREWHDIDILVIDERNKFVVVIENKIDSQDHDGQLNHYYDVAKNKYPNYKLLLIYLTPDGNQPSEDVKYECLLLSYSSIADVLDGLTDNHIRNLDVKVLIRHYVQMLRRFIVADSDIAKLCLSIYSNHKRALDLIYEHRPDLQSELKVKLEEIVKKVPYLELDSSSKTVIRFVPKVWDTPLLMSGEGWTQKGRMFMFQFENRTNNLRIGLVIGPGPTEVRQKLYEKSFKHFGQKNFTKLYPKWTTVKTWPVLDAKHYESGNTVSELESQIVKVWEQFLAQDLQLVLNSLKPEQLVPAEVLNR